MVIRRLSLIETSISVHTRRLSVLELQSDGVRVRHVGYEQLRSVDKAEFVEGFVQIFSSFFFYTFDGRHVKSPVFAVDHRRDARAFHLKGITLAEVFDEFFEFDGSVVDGVRDGFVAAGDAVGFLFRLVRVSVDAVDVVEDHVVVEGKAAVCGHFEDFGGAGGGDDGVR